MTRLNYERDILRLIDDAKRGRRENLAPASGALPASPVIDQKKFRSYIAFVRNCAAAHLLGNDMPPLPRALRGLVYVGNGKYADQIIRQWVKKRPEFDKALRALSKKKKFQRRLLG